MFFVNVEVALHREGKWLLIIRSENVSYAGGTLSFPGGTVEVSDSSDSTLEATARRECSEELGFPPEFPLSYVSSSHFISDTGERVLNTVFSSPFHEDSLVNANANEVQEVLWLTLEETKSHPKATPWLLSNMLIAEENRVQTKNGD